MSLEDAKARFRARVGPNAPQLALADNTPLMAIASALLAEAEDIRTGVTSAQTALFISSATGSDLAARAADFNVPVSQGSFATGYATFIAPAPVTTAVLVPQGVVVSTGGDGITTVAQTFTTATATAIPQGATTNASNQQETVTITGSPTGGTVTLTHNGQTTGPIAYSATALAVQSAVQALSNVGTSPITGQSNVGVSGPAGGPWVVTWQYALGGLIWPIMTAASSLTGGSSPTVATAITAPVQGVPITATGAGVAGNVADGTITAISTPVSNLTVSNSLSVGGTATVGGADPDIANPALVRANIYKVLQPKYGTAAVEAAVLAVPGVYDAYCLDPQNGSGTITVYWADQYGNQTNALYPSMSAGVQAAVAAILPPNIIPSYSAFTIVNLSAVSVSVSAPTAQQTTTLTPQVQAAVAAHVQGNGTPRSGLIHNQVPNGFAVGYTVQTGTNPQSNAPSGTTPVVGLTYFVLGATTPAIGAASNTVLYRLTGAPASVVSVTRV